MGLGLVKDRLGKTNEALPILEQALEHYLKERTQGHQVVDSSIIAKAHTSVGKAQEKLGAPDKAARHFAESLRIFRATVGEYSPLTAGALMTYGKLRMNQGPEHHHEATVLLTKALKLEVGVDSFHLQTVWELLQHLKDLGMQGMQYQQQEQGDGARAASPGLGGLKATFGSYVPLITLARKRVTAALERDELGTLAVFYKTAGELCCLAQDYAQGEELLDEALRLLRKVDDFDCSGLIEGCEQMVMIARSNRAQPAEAPRVVDVTDD